MFSTEKFARTVKEGHGSITKEISGRSGKTNII